MKKNKLITEYSIRELERVLSIKRDIADLENKLGQLLVAEIAMAAPPAQRLPKRTMSAAAKAKISAAQKARWAEKKTEATPEPPEQKRTILGGGRARFAAAAKARWAKYNAEKKKKAAV